MPVEDAWKFVKMWRKDSSTNLIPESWRSSAKERQIYAILRYIQLICGILLSFVILPVWLLSRAFQFIFPLLFIIANEMSINNDNRLDWKVILFDKYLFQTILTCMYWSLFLIWLLFFINVSNFYYWIHHIGVGADYLNQYGINTVQMFDDICKFYEKHVSQKIIVSKILNDVFGKDLGPIVFYYFSMIDLDAKPKKKTDETKYKPKRNDTDEKSEESV